MTNAVLDMSLTVKLTEKWLTMGEDQLRNNLEGRLVALHIAETSQRIARSQADTSSTDSQMHMSSDNLLSDPANGQTNNSLFGTNPSTQNY